MVKALALAVILIAATACQTVRGSFCDIARPQRPSAQEIASMTDQRASEVLAHNLKGQQLCGWKP